MLTGEARVGAVLVDRGGAHRHRPPERQRRLGHPRDGVLVARGDVLDERAREREAGRDGEARA